MDGGERRASQYATPYQSQIHHRPTTGQPMGPPAHERYSHTLHSPARTDISRSSNTRQYGSSYGYGYHDSSFATSHLQSGSPMQGVEMYNPSYIQESSRSQIQQSPSHQQYTSYAPGTMLPPVQYEAMPFQRAVQVLGTQFSTYLPHGDHSSVGVGDGSSRYMTSQAAEQPVYSMSMSGPVLQPPFAAPSGDYPMLDHGVNQEPQEPDHDQEALDESTRQYEQQLKTTFDAISAGRVTEAGEKVLGLSRWLLSSVVSLGLHHDDESKHSQRLTMWREFNHCWEALGQKQKDITEDALRSRHEPSDLMTADTITNLIDDFVTLCDQVEQYGLVDYEMGVWEEQVVSVFIACLDLLPQDETATRIDSAEPGTT